jgi:hypothetical protein
MEDASDRRAFAAYPGAPVGQTLISPTVTVNYPTVLSWMVIMSSLALNIATLVIVIVLCVRSQSGANTLTDGIQSGFAQMGIAVQSVGAGVTAVGTGVTSLQALETGMTALQSGLTSLQSGLLALQTTCAPCPTPAPPTPCPTPAPTPAPPATTTPAPPSSGDVGN